VEVSIDGGKTWKQARLIGPDMGKYAWRQFVLQAQLPKGTYSWPAALPTSRAMCSPKRVVKTRAATTTPAGPTTP
jgi:hypothetical protein